MTRFVDGVFRLRINRDKTAVASIGERKSLWDTVCWPKVTWGSPRRARIVPGTGVRQITRRNRGVSVEQISAEPDSFLTGWAIYSRLAACKTHLTELDGWLRRKLCCVWLKHRKRTGTPDEFFRIHGVSERISRVTALSGKGW